MASLFPDDARRRADSNYCRSRGRNASERRPLRAGAGTAIRSELQPRHRNIFGTSDFACVGHRCSHLHAERAGPDRRLAISGLQRPSLPTSEEKSASLSILVDSTAPAPPKFQIPAGYILVGSPGTRSAQVPPPKPDCTQSRQRRRVPADCVRIGSGRPVLPHACSQ